MESCESSTNTDVTDSINIITYFLKTGVIIWIKHSIRDQLDCFCFDKIFCHVIKIMSRKKFVM